MKFILCLFLFVMEEHFRTIVFMVRMVPKCKNKQQSHVKNGKVNMLMVNMSVEACACVLFFVDREPFSVCEAGWRGTDGDFVDAHVSGGKHRAGCRKPQLEAC